MTSTPTDDLVDGAQWTARRVAEFLGYTGKWAATSANTTLRRYGITAIPGVTRVQGGGAAKVYDATEVVARLSPANRVGRGRTASTDQQAGPKQ